jgi:hypothetical protein
MGDVLNDLEKVKVKKWTCLVKDIKVLLRTSAEDQNTQGLAVSAEEKGIFFVKHPVYKALIKFKKNYLELSGTTL